MKIVISICAKFFSSSHVSITFFMTIWWICANFIIFQNTFPFHCDSKVMETLQHEEKLKKSHHIFITILSLFDDTSKMWRVIFWQIFQWNWGLIHFITSSWKCDGNVMNDILYSFFGTLYLNVPTMQKWKQWKNFTTMDHQKWLIYSKLLVLY